ncbi:hypothetical protein GCM10023187_36470 [Nibrella viscosa]|uniref:Barstar (barnase inhibitor) domain-containing protein n=1 Tax=Nibrella viscosa TaxID=1084524 RepID=A0ABP8KMN6_9BACT
MSVNIYVATSAEDLKKFPDFAIVKIEGQKSKTLRQFYEHIAEVLEFPDYFGFNLDSLDELLNDLEWIDDHKLALYFCHTEDFISQERNPEKLSNLLHMLDATAEDWKWLDEDEEVFAKELVFIFEDSPRLRDLLKQEEIGFAFISRDADSAG